MSDSSLGSWLQKVLREYALKLLGARDYSTKTLSDKLKNQTRKIVKKVGIDESIQKEVIKELLEWLKLKKFLDDERYATRFVEGRLQRKGKRLIQMELVKKGIDKELISQVLELSTGSQSEVAERLLEQKSKNWRIDNEYKLKQKGLSLLMRNGFEYEISRELVERWFKKKYNEP